MFRDNKGMDNMKMSLYRDKPHAESWEEPLFTWVTKNEYRNGDIVITKYGRGIVRYIICNTDTSIPITAVLY